MTNSLVDALQSEVNALGAQLQDERQAKAELEITHHRELTQALAESADHRRALAQAIAEKADHQRALTAALRENLELRLQLEKVLARQRLLLAQRFAARSEQGEYQGNLFDEAEANAEVDTGADEGTEPEASASASQDTVIEVAAHCRVARRSPLPQDLPRVIEEHPLTSCACGVCGEQPTPLEPIVSEQLDVIPAQLFVREHRRQRGVCRRCDVAPITAPLPAQPIPKSLASPGLLAYTAISKYGDGLPLYRQSAMHERSGVALPRQTLASHMVEAGRLLTPLLNLITDHLLSYDVLSIDETRVQVLKEPGKPAQSDSTMWVLRGGPVEQPAVRFEYDVSRGKAVAERLLEGYAGYLQRDGYAAYRQLSHGVTGKIHGLGCWAHVRRKFLEAVKALPKKDQQKTTPSHKAMQFITALYGLESRIEALLPDDKRQQRQQHALPILKDFKAWLDERVLTIEPRSFLGAAIGYALKEWPYLTTYCEDGRLRIDNRLGSIG